MKTSVARWGNSLALRLPKKLAASYNISGNSNVELIEKLDDQALDTVRIW
ncbi:MAG: hypothetical protein JJT75_03200 [Opitutales bacterium]|nr:hypothetical protein [Opitutales bacterium]MCH8541787.1 AbrB/MazE/SpoVT family DNA-binding domain-containing protein [Opitutales bacterium]